MAAFCALILALVALICSVSYWFSWEIQHKERRLAFTTRLRNDITQLLGRESSGIPASDAQSIAAQSERCDIHARTLTGK